MCLQTKLERIAEIRNILVSMRTLAMIRDPKFGRAQDMVRVTEFNPEDRITRTEMAERKNYGYFYYYIGPLDEKTREFCRIVLTVDKVFSLADINELSTQAGYDVFEYQPGPIVKKGGPGGPNCRHGWVKFRGEVVDTPAPTDNQISKIARNSVFK